MRGHVTGQTNLFVRINLEELVPADHPIRAIKRMADGALKAMSRTFAAAYAGTGRPGVPPERLLKALVLMSLYTIRSERALCERITFDMLLRWFLDMTPDEPCFDHAVFSHNHERLMKTTRSARRSTSSTKRSTAGSSSSAGSDGCAWSVAGRSSNWPTSRS